MTTTTSTKILPAHQLFFRRVAAYIIDILLLFGILFPLGWAVVLLVGFSPTTGVQIWQATLINFSLPSWLYFIFSDSLLGGQTLGKRLLKIKVVGPFSLSLGVPRAILRTAVKLLPWELAHIGGFALGSNPRVQWVCIGLSNLLIVVYLIAMVASHSRFSIHDWIAHTEVIGISSPAAPRPTSEKSSNSI